MVRPKWSLQCIEEKHEISFDTDVNGMINSLSEFPQDAWITGNEYAYALEVYWTRDMTDQEYEKERQARKKKRADIQVRKLAQLKKLAKELDVTLG